MFCRYALRTLDVEAARRFYAETLGLDLPDGASDGSALEVRPLPDRARDKGAPPHWLGHIGVRDLGRTEARLIELGAEKLGRRVETEDGAALAALRDPWGAVLAIRAPGEAPSDPPIAWHQLHTRDLEAAWSTYSELFGWAQAGTIDVADPEGGHLLFAWTEGSEPIGSMANTARWPGVHAHWLFHFPVADVDATLARVRALGGQAFDPVELPDGSRLGACDDPQGAAFGVIGLASAR